MMKKIFLLTCIIIVFSAPAFSQAYESSITYNKKKQKTIAIDYAYSLEAVHDAIEQKMKKLGYAGQEEKGLFNNDKGFIVFKDALFADISSERMDYILKIDKKNRRETDVTTLYLVLNKAGEDAISSMSASDIRKTKSFLNDLLPEIEEANLALKIADQDASIVKSEKKIKDLQDEKAALEEKLKKNLEDIENQQRQIESQRHSLDSLKGKRKLPQ